MDYKEKIQKLINGEMIDGIRASEIQIGVLKALFPEFTESEDEKVRKDVISYVQQSLDSGYGIIDKDRKEKWIAWLEKQGEQKQDPCKNCKNVGLNYHNFPCIEKRAFEQGKSVLEVINEETVDNTNKVEPKFKVGDWVIDKQGIVHQIYNIIENVTNHTYGYDIVGGEYFNDNTEGVRLWTIQDAKDGDVLTTDTWTFIFKKYQDKSVNYHCATSAFNNFSISDTGEFDSNYVHPATKEQRDLLFQKMKEAGYTWDAEKKEVKKIEQKSAEWSEEDNKIIEEIINDIECVRAINYHAPKECYEFRENWLKSLKYRVQPQPQQEWSEEDKINYNYALTACIYYGETHGYTDTETHQKTIDWLKFLRPQSTWKPSLSQLNALGVVAKGNAPDDIEEINSLYNDLKKL